MVRDEAQETNMKPEQDRPCFSFVCLVTAHFVPEKFSSALKGCEYHPKPFGALRRHWRASWGKQHHLICTVGGNAVFLEENRS